MRNDLKPGTLEHYAVWLLDELDFGPAHEDVMALHDEDYAQEFGVEWPKKNQEECEGCR